MGFNSGFKGLRVYNFSEILYVQFYRKGYVILLSESKYSGFSNEILLDNK